MFKARSNKERMIPAGKKLSWTLDKQISKNKDETKLADALGQIVVIFSVLTICLSLVVGFFRRGDLLSTWMYVNSMQMIAHIPLV